MPTYTLKSPEGETTTRRLSFKEYAKVKSGALKLVDDVGNPLELVFAPGKIGFVMKDGESGGWASKAMHERKLRAARGEVMKAKERDHVYKNRLIPNYKGQEASSWKEAQEAAKHDKGHLSALTFEGHVKKENGK
jgi:hypothetical protein